ncbi:MAG: hypothetical protein ACI9SY_000454 [Candidatus Paceibacteria bacterium]|jgi:hypothetical protein
MTGTANDNFYPAADRVTVWVIPNSAKPQAILPALTVLTQNSVEHKFEGDRMFVWTNIPGNKKLLAHALKELGQTRWILVARAHLH